MKSTRQVLHTLLVIAVLAICHFQLTAQTNYFFGTSSGTGGATGSGYTVANQKVTFSNAATSMLGTTNVTVSLSNQQYGNATTHPFEGMTSPTYSGGVAFGAAGGNSGTNNVPSSQTRYANLNLYGSPLNSHFTINKSATAGTGINAATTKALTIGVFTDVLIDALGNNINGISDLATNIQFADITLTFNEPVSNPVIHLGGLGGTTDTVMHGSRQSWLGYAGVFELLDGYSISRLSGPTTFDVNTTTKRAGDNAVWIGANSSVPQCYGGRQTYGASGSFSVNGVNITTLTFRIYLRSDAGRVTDKLTSPPCDGSVVEYPFSATTDYPHWSGTNIVRADGLTLSVSFAREKIMGNVFNDPDGGNVDNSTGVANLIPSGIYANLIDTATGFVLKSVAVGINGVYDFGEWNANGYSVVLSSSLGTNGSIPPTFTPPAGWVSTGAFIGTPNTGNTGNSNGVSEQFSVTEAENTTNINFAIQQLPQSDNHTTTIAQPNSGDVISLNGIGSNPPLLSGSDVEDGTYTGSAGTVRNPSGVIITSLPVNGVLYYDGNPVAAGDTILNPSLLKIELTGTGYNSFEFEYAYLDAAGYADPTPATYGISWNTILPVTLVSFNAFKKGEEALLEWATASEQNNKGFAIERSNDGVNWMNIGFVASSTINGNSNTKTDYSFIDNAPLNGVNYYRLKQIDFDNKIEYSPIRTVSFKNQNSIHIYPNPVRNNLTIAGLADAEQIRIVNASGQVVYHIKATTSTINISTEHFSEGLYYVQVVNADGKISSHKFIKIK